MAISILVQGSSGNQTAVDPYTVSVTLSAGAGNRRMFVSWLNENDTTTPVITYGGQSLSLCTDGTQTANVSPDSIGRATIYELREANMPSNGSQTLSVDWAVTGNDNEVYWFILDGVDQTTNLDDVNVNSVLGAGAAGTTIGTTVTATDAGSFLLSIGYKNNTTGTLSLTAPASSTTDADINAATNGARFGVAHKLGSLTVGSNTVTWTHSSEARRGVVALVVKPSSTTNTAASPSFVSGAASAAATGVVDHVASGAAFASGAASSAATAVLAHVAASASFVSDAASSAATAVLAHVAAGASFVSGAASASATGVVGIGATAAFVSGDASASATGVVGHVASGAAFVSGAASSAATGVVAHVAASASFVSGAASAAATATRGLVGTAAFVSGSASMSATASNSHIPDAVFGATATISEPYSSARVRGAQGTAGVSRAFGRTRVP